MSNRDESSEYLWFKHLQLIEQENEDKRTMPPIVALRRRISRTPPRALPRIRLQSEVRIAPSLDDARIRLVSSPARGEAATNRVDIAMFNRLALICEKIADGAYDRPEVLDSVARRIVASGALNSHNDDR